MPSRLATLPREGQSAAGATVSRPAQCASSGRNWDGKVARLPRAPVVHHTDRAAKAGSEILVSADPSYASHLGSRLCPRMPAAGDKRTDAHMVETLMFVGFVATMVVCIVLIASALD